MEYPYDEFGFMLLQEHESHRLRRENAALREENERLCDDAPKAPVEGDPEGLAEKLGEPGRVRLPADADGKPAHAGNEAQLPVDGQLATPRLRARLDERGIEWRGTDDKRLGFTTVCEGLPSYSIVFDELGDGSSTRLQAFYSHLGDDPLEACDITAELALEGIVAVREFPEDGYLQNFTFDNPFPFGEHLRLVPRVGSCDVTRALPEWVDWAESLRHDDPATIRDIIEQVMWQAMERGHAMGPNGVTHQGIDEGAVTTEWWLDGVVSRLAALLEEDECWDMSRSDYWFECSRCGTHISKHYADTFSFCPSCGARVVKGKA